MVFLQLPDILLVSRTSCVVFLEQVRFADLLGDFIVIVDSLADILEHVLLLIN